MDSIATTGLPSYFLCNKLYDGKLVFIQLIDTVGEERFRSLNSLYYVKADIVFLVYDITNRNSFEERKEYYRDEIKKKCKENIKVFLLGNKNDCEEKRVVSMEEGYNFALKNNYFFMETSCAKNENVYEVFEDAIIEAHLIKIKERKKKKTIKDSKKNDNCRIM